ncbi:MAG: hypothetical protein LBH42_02670 [Treponema sp.]|jgi:tetratricopeptide (TPR) repeat protein|nr:hypothetical protein [Treponema sp.]
MKKKASPRKKISLAAAKRKNKNFLRKVCIIGLVLGVTISWCMVFLVLFVKKDTDMNTTTNAFSRSLIDYDLLDAPKRVVEGENPRQIENRLSRLEKQAKSPEEQLSVLKRRRVLALIDRSYAGSYAKAARAAAEAHPYSSPIAAVAAEAVLLTPLTESDRILLRSYASRVTQNRFDMLDLGLRILAGDLDDPARAAEIPAFENLLSMALSAEQIQRDLLINEFLLLAQKRDISGASIKLNNLLASTVPEISPGDISMAAEFFYDHNFYLRAAEFFLRLEDNIRAADALVLAGEIPGARNIWYALSQPSPTEDSYSRQIRMRSIYNMASSSLDREEEASWLEKLFTQQSIMPEGMRIYSVIRYTRLLDEIRSVAILDAENMKENPLLDLELLRRKLETLPPIRSTAEVWLLLGRHPHDDALYEWAAWFFEHQRLYNETSHLFREANHRRVSGSWYYLHRGLALLRDGKTAEGERIFREALQYYPDWRISANLGRIQESHRAIAAALGYYETAAAMVLATEKSQAAQLQIRISR